jgi:TolB protein
VKRLALFAALCFAVPALAQAPVIEISGANFRPMPLAVTPPASQDPAAKEHAGDFDSALMLDLSATGIFQMLDRKSFLSDPKEGITAASINFNNWSNVGAEALVKTQLMTEGENLRADLRLFTVATAKEELKVSHSVPAKQARRLAHFLADALFKYFTQEPGPFESHLAYAKRNGKWKDIWYSDWDGHNAVQVTSGELAVLPAAMRDGDGVAYTSYRSGKPEIYAHRLGARPVVLVRAGQMATGIAYSPDGKRIAYALAEGDSAQIYTARADGSDPKAVTNTPFFINTSPTWSPDGKQIAFVSNRGGSPQIYIMGADGSNPHRITFQGNYNQTPDWSPRGDLIAFTARDERNAFDLFTINVDSGKVTRLTQDQGNNEEPSFSPNGRLIVFTSNRTGTSQLYVMTTDGSTQIPLPVERGDYATPSWGP